MNSINVSYEDIITLSAEFQSEIDRIRAQLDDISDIRLQFSSGEDEKYDIEKNREAAHEICDTMTRFIEFSESAAQEYAKCETSVTEAIELINLI